MTRGCNNDKEKKCGCCPDFCPKGKKYHEIYCCDGDKCGADRCGGCKCALISLEVTANPTVVSTIGQSIEYTYSITNDGTVDLCGFIQICSTKNGSIELVKKRDTFIPKGSRLTVRRTYITTAQDFQCDRITDKSAAFVQVDGHNWVHSQKVCVDCETGGADVFGQLTQVLGGGVASATLTVGNLASSYVPATAVTLLLKYPLGLTQADVTITAAAGLSQNEEGILVTLPILQPGESRVFTFTYPAVAGTVATAYTWAGVVKSATHDPFLENNRVFSVLEVPIAP